MVLRVERTPHPALRATFSHKGRRKKELHHLTAPLRDQPRGALVAGVDPEPAQCDTEAVAEPNQEVDVGDAPDPPGDRAAQLDAAEVDHREPLADLGEAAGVLV